MSINREVCAAALVAYANDSRLVGRIRLQKIAYLLKSLGAPVPFQFGYYHYGPYAQELEKAVYDAEKSGLVTEEIKHRHSDRAPYSVFNSTTEGKKAAEPFSESKELIKKLSGVNPIVLELAATAHWLVTEERVENWDQEIHHRKTWKVNDGRLEQALKLLDDLNLPPGKKPS